MTTGAILLLLLVGIGTVMVARLTLDPWLPVSETLVVPRVSTPRLERAILLLLSNVRGARVAQTAAGTLTVEVRRSPGWIWLPLVLTFPLGLLFLMVKNSGSLQVRVTATSSGAEVRMIGRTKKSVVTTLAKSLGSLDASVTRS